jgi:hypothetical protein
LQGDGVSDLSAVAVTGIGLSHFVLPALFDPINELIFATSLDGTPT